MRKIPLGFAAAVLSTALLAMAAAPAGAAVADCKKKDGQSSSTSKRDSDRPAADKDGSGAQEGGIQPVAAHPCVPSQQKTTTVHSDAKTHVEYLYRKIAQVWNGEDKGYAKTLPSDSEATWDRSKAVVLNGKTMEFWGPAPGDDNGITGLDGKHRILDQAFTYGYPLEKGQTGWYKYTQIDKKTVTDKAASDKTVVTGKDTVCPSPSTAPEIEKAEKPSAPKSSEAAVQPADDASPSAGVPTSIDAGLAGSHTKDSSVPSMWPVFALGGAAVIVLGIIIAMRRRAAARA